MSRYICDGHEYRVIDEGLPCEGDRFSIRNNYGKRVAELSREVYEEYWHLEVVGSGLIASWHENDVIDNLLEERAVQAYVAWAMDNDTVEEHYNWSKS